MKIIETLYQNIIDNLKNTFLNKHEHLKKCTQNICSNYPAVFSENLQTMICWYYNMKTPNFRAFQIIKNEEEMYSIFYIKVSSNRDGE